MQNLRTGPADEVASHYDIEPWWLYAEKQQLK
jgi:hypothetical protein